MSRRLIETDEAFGRSRKCDSVLRKIIFWSLQMGAAEKRALGASVVGSAGKKIAQFATSFQLSFVLDDGNESESAREFASCRTYFRI